MDEHIHASDRARALRSATETPKPGSIEEAEALALIDEARCDLDDEISGRADRRMRRAHRRYWSERGAQLS